MKLVKLLSADCHSTDDIQAKLKRLFAGTIEQMLEAEMDEHLGYEKIQLLETTPAISETATVKRRSAAITASVNGIVFNSRKDNKIISKCVYSVLGINMGAEGNSRHMDLRKRVGELLRKRVLGPQKPRCYGHFHRLP